MTARLDRLIAEQTGTSRRQVAKLIRRGRVRVDGADVRDPGQHVTLGASAVEVDGRPLVWERHLTLMLHKPAGVVSATSDEAQQTVLGLLAPDLRRRGLAPVGRLDKDTTGLLLLTTDGALNHALTHPRRHVPRVYVVDLAGLLAPDAVERFVAGVELRDGTRCRPTSLELLPAPLRARVVLTEGRYHQVKRMVAACGSRVAALHREAIGPLHLDPTLPPGHARRVTPAELAALLDAASGARARSEEPA